MNWGGEGQKFMQGWQDAVQKALETQAEWTRRWTAGSSSQKPKGKTGV
jgi:hypothetical protein